MNVHTENSQSSTSLRRPQELKFRQGQYPTLASHTFGQRLGSDVGAKTMYNPRTHMQIAEEGSRSRLVSQ